MPHGSGIRAYKDVFTVCLRRRVPVHVSGSINIASFKLCKNNRQHSKVNGTAVNYFIYIKRASCLFLLVAATAVKAELAVESTTDLQSENKQDPNFSVDKVEPGSEPG